MGSRDRDRASADSGGYTSAPKRSAEAAQVDECGPMPQRFVAERFRGAEVNGAARLRILAYGDSLTAGFYNDGDRFAPYGAAMVEALSVCDGGCAVELWMCGLSGLEASEMVVGLDRRVLEDCVDRMGKGLRRILVEHGPFDVVLIMAGTNDLGDRDIPATAIATTVQALHTACHARGVRTVALSVPPSISCQESKTYRGRWERLNSLLREWCQGVGATEGAGLWVDTAEIVPFAEPSEFWEEDGLHFSPEGSNKLGKSLALHLAPFLAALPPPPRAAPLAEGGPMPQRFLPPAMPGDAEPDWRLLAYGDSLTAGYHAFGKLFAPYAEALSAGLFAADVSAEVWVCGLSGQTVSVMAAKPDAEELKDVCKRTGKGIRRVLSESGPFDLALLMVGTNDLGKSDPETIFANVRALHEECHQAGVRTVALSVPPSEAANASVKLNKKRRQVNALLQKWASESTGEQGVALFVETGDLLPFDETSGLWEMDGLHFSRDGSRELGAKLAPLVRPLLSDDKKMHSAE